MKIVEMEERTPLLDISFFLKYISFVTAGG